MGSRVGGGDSHLQDETTVARDHGMDPQTPCHETRLSHFTRREWSTKHIQEVLTCRWSATPSSHGEEEVVTTVQEFLATHQHLWAHDTPVFTKEAMVVRAVDRPEGSCDPVHGLVWGKPSTKHRLDPAQAPSIPHQQSTPGGVLLAVESWFPYGMTDRRRNGHGPDTLIAGIQDHDGRIARDTIPINDPGSIREVAAVPHLGDGPACELQSLSSRGRDARGHHHGAHERLLGPEAAVA
jgi:hypothetical protein